MLNNHPVLKCTIKFILPFIIFFALYIQINGESSPGGGFQAGSIFASSIIALDFITDKFKISYAALRNIAALGVIIYFFTGLIPIFQGYQYFDYYSLAKDSHTSQKIGIFIIELGVGFTVSSGMLLIYFLFDRDVL